MSDSVWEALAAIQADPPAIFKDGRGQYGSYLTLGNLMDALQPKLTEQGLALTQLVTVWEGEPALTTHLRHVASDTQLESTMLLMSAQANPQQQGSAITYARRYALGAMFGLVADEDDDGQSVTDAVNRQRPAQRTQRPRRREAALG